MGDNVLNSMHEYWQENSKVSLTLFILFGKYGKLFCLIVQKSIEWF